MKTLEDYQREVLDGMVQNQTLIYNNEHYEIPDGISDDEVKEALQNRYSEKLNEYLTKPFGKAMIRGAETRSIVDSAVEKFTNQIISDCKMLYITPPVKDRIKEFLSDNLKDHYKKNITSY